MLKAERAVPAAGAEADAAASALRPCDERLNESAVLTLCKFMSVSETYCDRRLQLLFTVLERSKQASVRQTVVVALGDLVVRFPSLLDPWVGRIRERLRDESTSVRKSTLMILRHLVLNNMVKVHADDIYELALCILDADASIAGLGRLFLSEFAARNVSNVYNILPSTMKRLVGAADSELSPGQFDTVVTHLASFVDKGWQIESLTEKLCVFLGEATSEPQQGRKLAKCLAALKEESRGTLKVRSSFLSSSSHILVCSSILLLLYSFVCAAGGVVRSVPARAARRPDGAYDERARGALRQGSRRGVEAPPQRGGVGRQGGGCALEQVASGGRGGGGGRSKRGEGAVDAQNRRRSSRAARTSGGRRERCSSVESACVVRNQHVVNITRAIHFLTLTTLP